LILYCASDLLWATRIKRLAEDLGLLCRPVRNPDMLRDRLSEGPVAGLIVDLEAPEAEAVLAAAAPATSAEADADSAASALSRPRRVVAFGPHVDRERLQMARDRGAETLTRGAFEATLPQILRRLGEG
jgi:hypothetical protein